MTSDHVEKHAKTLPVQRIPRPSLLISLMNEHLDPGYAQAARDRGSSHTRLPSRAQRSWLAAAMVLVVTLLTTAYLHNRDQLPSAETDRQAYLHQVRTAAAEDQGLERSRSDLANEVADARSKSLAGSQQGATLLDQIARAEQAAAATPVSGPGASVTIADPGTAATLSDATTRTPGTAQVVLDRDLQLVVNQLWVGGAEAIAVNGIRIGPGMTIRQAGGAMLVDLQPVSSPYTVEAIGPGHAMANSFTASSASGRLAVIARAYGVRVTVETKDTVRLPAASTSSGGNAGPAPAPTGAPR